MCVCKRKFIKCDMFAFGATMMHLCSGQLLGESTPALKDVATPILYNEKQRKCIGAFLSRFLTRTAEERCPSTAEAMKHALALLEETPWV